jgi:rod shape-determining protein MreD
MNSLLLILILLLFPALQSLLPTAWWLGGIRIELMPALVVYAALTLPRNGAIAIAFAAGFLQDSLSAGPFGLHAAVYATGTALITTMHEILDRELPFVQIGAGMFITAAASLVAGNSILKSFILVLLSAVITPALFLALDTLRYLVRREA